MIKEQYFMVLSFHITGYECDARIQTQMSAQENQIKTSKIPIILVF